MCVDRGPSAMPHQEGEEVDLVIIGAGLEALGVVDRLSESVQQRTVVVDPSGEWLTGWESWCDGLQPGLLREPITLHAGADPSALGSYAEKQGRSAVRSPGTAVQGTTFEVLMGDQRAHVFESPVPSTAHETLGAHGWRL